MEIGQMGCNFSEELVLPPPPAIRPNRVTLKNTDYIFKELSIYIEIFPGRFCHLFLCIPTESRPKMKKI